MRAKRERHVTGDYTKKLYENDTDMGGAAYGWVKVEGKRKHRNTI